jgi:hypothetical protein
MVCTLFDITYINRLTKNSLYNHAIKQSQALKRDLDTFAASPENTPLALQGWFVE